MKKILLNFILFGVFSVGRLQAQDIHFSQFFTTPLLVNPANTGFFNCDYRFTADYRSQWKSITVPFSTFTASGDLRLVKGHNKNIVGLGFVAAVDKAGDSKFTTSQFGVSLAFHKNLDRFGTSYLGGGILLSYQSATIDYSGLLFSDQYNSSGPPYNTTSENIALNTLSFVDVSAGLAYNYIFDHDHSFSLGGAVYHINQPVESFTGDNTSRLPMKFVLNGGAEFRVSSHLEFLPKTMFELQGTSNELLFGSFARVNLDKLQESKYGVYLGAWYRWGDSFIIVTRFDIDNFSLSFSYDINVSPLEEVSDARGGPELSLIYIGCIPTLAHKSVFCPRF